ncbi:MAG: iron-containing alcohol dehydrogenase [Deltaproteobacteria bacterium]|nr:iron-containing alcohol dehydrogenase [Deltaproteobacteria bacterium]MBN2674028.1 iron-containing alcohol dehydrogenase [Deltaproteobacteria bacterium]
MEIPQQSFSFLTATRIEFGAQKASTIGREAASFGARALLVCGATADRAEKLLANSPVSTHTFSIPSEPTTDDVIRGTALARQSACDLVIAVGGGSVIDAGKAISAMLTNDGELFDYLEVIGRGKPLSRRTVPFIAVPTTAGTGAEVTKNAVLRSVEHRVKVSMRSNYMLPDLAIIDPELTYSVPPAVTAATGLDALTQVIEPFVSQKSNSLTDALCREGIRRAARSLRSAFDEGDNPGAREDMALTSLFGGIGLANAGLGAVHGIAGPMGGMFPIPHGVICGRLLPSVFAANAAEACKTKPLRRKFAEVSALLTGRQTATVEEGIQWLNDLCTHLNITGFSSYGVTETDIPAIVAAAEKASSMKGNPVRLTTEKLTDILRRSL